VNTRSGNVRKRTIVLLAAAACAATGAHAGSTGSAVTISLSGSTALKGFTTSEGLTFVNPNSVVSVGGISYPGSANDWSSLTSFQLAPFNASGAVTTGSDQAANALRVEWHEQGSVEGILELVNDQIAPVDSVTATNRNPTFANPVWVNRNKFDATAGKSAGDTLSGFNLGAVNTVGGGPTGVAQFNLNGVSTTNGQNAVQMGISDVNARQGFAIAGTSAFNRTPGQAGYGKGNTALPSGANAQALGQGNVRHELANSSVLNMPAGTINPRTGAAFGVGPWNTAGIANLDNKAVAVTATLFVANPGTGLEKLNRTDAQFLETAGRLPNGADFNVATRDVNSGPLNVASLNVGLDPSFTVGENDSGNGNAADGGTAQVQIGPSIRFSNKTSGGSGLRPTVQNARMAVGHLSMSDSIGSTNNNAARPLRALAYRDDANDVADNSNNAFRPSTATGDARDSYSDPVSNTFVRASAQTIVDGSYALYQNETYVTVKKPSATFAGDTAAQWAARTDATTGIQGDTANADVAHLRQNVLSSVATFPHTSTVATPADALVDNSFILPQFMQVNKGQDGINQSAPNALYDSTLSGQFLASPALVSKFNPDDPATVTKGGSTSTYGGVAPAGAGAIAMTGQNYLFGNFRQNGIRDFEAIKAAQDAQAKLFASGAGVDMFTGSANSTVVPGLAAPLANMANQAGGTGATKGDLIVMGDFNADGKFDGKDLYAMARGAALADNASSTTLTLGTGIFGDAVRRGVLRKNAALDYMQATATPQQKVDASASLANDPTGQYTFDKFDVNRDGKVNLYDGKIVARIANRNAGAGSDIASLVDQLSSETSVVGATGGLAGPLGSRMISLVDAELNDDGKVTGHNGPGIAVAAASDFALIQSRVRGDFNFDSQINGQDINPFVNALLDPSAFAAAVPDVLASDLPIVGDFNNDGLFNGQDINGFVAKLLGSGAATPAEVAPLYALTSVPEPGASSLVGLSAAILLRRRHRRLA
jgi:hypothetical protein